MPINLTPGKEQVNTINSKPLAYITGVAILFATVMTTMYLRSDDKRAKELERRVTFLELENRELRAELKRRDSLNIRELEEIKKNTNEIVREAIKGKTISNN